MSDYNWCHGPNCHTNETQSRVRGSGNNKVLRTIKIKIHSHNQYGNDIFNYFCNTRCLYDYLGKYAHEIARIAPRTAALETPITVTKTKSQDYRYQWSDGESRRVPYMSTSTAISRVDND